MTVRTHARQEGFALFIVAALFIAFALVATAMIDRTNATQQITLQTNTRDQLSRLNYALIRYAIDHSNRYPCPADPQVAYTNAAFGQPIANCHIGVSGGVIAITSGQNSVRGMVPVRELLPYGIQPDDAFDAWGNRIIYYIDQQLTPLGTGIIGGTRFSITDIYTAVLAKDPDFVLISYGRDGIGGTPKNSTSIAIACAAGFHHRVQNCDTNAIFWVGPILIGPSAPVASYYDDILSYYGK